LIISVALVTIVKNEVNRIRGTLESVVKQTIPPSEWIVIDGGSNDGTINILLEYQKYFTSFIVEEDGGIYDAMNKGINLCNSDYVLFLNGGDYLNSKNVLEFINDNSGSDLLSGNIEVRSGQDYIIWCPPTRIDPDFFYDTTLPHCGTVIKKSLFLDFGLYDNTLKICGDYEWFVRLVNNKTDLKYYKIDLTIATYFKDGISTHNERLRIKENNRIKKAYPYIYRMRRKHNWFEFMYTSLLYPRYFLGHFIKLIFSRIK